MNQMEPDMTCGDMIKYAFSKFLIEGFGTFVLTILFIINNAYGLILGYWILIIFCYSISHAHFNPAITFVYMFRSDSKKVKIPMAVLMMAVQCAGAFAAAAYMNFMFWSAKPMVPNN